MVYFVRHGETDYNKQGIVQGQLDIPLNNEGINQANQLKDKLKNMDIDLIFSSPLLRAKQTAEIINKTLNVEIIYDNRLKEFFAGNKQGTKISEWPEEDKDNFKLHPENFGAESNLDFYNRCVSAFNDMPKNKNILIVSHGGVFRNLFRFVNNINDLTYPVSLPENCSISKF